MAERFSWLDEEIRTIKTRRFHVVDGRASCEFLEAVNQAELPFPEDYKQFVLQYGNCKLYRQRNAYLLGVRAAPVEFVGPNDERFWCFGHYQDRNAFFSEKALENSGESPVFESSKTGFKVVSENFHSWLTRRATEIRELFGKRRWRAILNGPASFSPLEREIVTARECFSWSIRDISPTGTVTFEVSNHSKLRLPYYSLGVRDRESSFEGIVWLDTGKIEPNQSGIITRECYKNLVPASRLEFFQLPKPEPEDREQYWEFKSG
ncbi:hypothetical protein SH501x_002546 [Pirellulaceae bacterium SH501]